MAIFPFKKKKSQEALCEQALSYWEESSYIIAIPEKDRIDMSDSVFDRLAAINGVEITDRHLPDSNGAGHFMVRYDGETYEVGFYDGDFSLPDFFGNQGYYFTDEEMASIHRARKAVTIFMKFGSDSKKSYHLQLKIAKAIVPDLLAVMDESAERLVSARWVNLAVESAVVPGSNALFTVQAVGGDKGEVWLHTHGLNRCGLYELEILRSDAENSNSHYNVIATLASHMLDHESEPPTPCEGVYIGMLSDQTPIVATHISWTKGLKEYPSRTLGGVNDRKEGHNGHTALVFLYTCEKDEINGIMHKVSEYDGRWEDNPIFFISSVETNRMSCLAQERFGIVSYMSRKDDCHILVKIGLETDTPSTDDEREHIWFELIESDGDRFKARLIQEPYNVSGMHEGDEGWYEKKDVTDWHIYIDKFAVTPDTAYLLV